MYYLYRHIRLDKNQVFYVGIGTIPRDNILKQLGYTHKSFYRRAYDRKKSRNPYWLNIINKTQYRVEIIFETNDIDLIKKKEIEFIFLYKDTLCNMTIGGDGIESYKHTEATKKKISRSLTGKKKSKSHINNINKRKPKKIIMYNDKEIHHFDSISDAGKYLGLNSIANISACLHKKRNKVRNYKFKFNNE